MRLSLVTILVPSYEMGIRFFVDGLGWQLLKDEDQGRKRWVTVAPSLQGDTSVVGAGRHQAQILLAIPTSEAQHAAMGAQTGGPDQGRVGFFLHTDDFMRDAARIKAAGGIFIEDARHEIYGTVAQWRDPWGNLWDLIEPAD